MQPNIELAIFDLDGTLINLKVDWNALKRARMFERDWVTIRQYELENMDHAKPIERGIEHVKKFKSLGCKLAICSSNMYETILQSLKKLELDKCFDYIIAGDHVYNHKPDPEGLNRIVKYFNVDKRKTVFIGNDWKDEVAGRRANIHTVLLEKIESDR